MRKTMLDAKLERAAEPAAWLDLESLAEVEITSEDPLFPIEHALAAEPTTGWRASATGRQVIRLRFDEPVEIHRMRLHVIDRAAERRQEMAVYAELAGVGRQEVWRGQYVFSPNGANEQTEDIAVSLPRTNVLELQIDPDGADTHRSLHYATLQSLRLA